MTIFKSCDPQNIFYESLDLVNCDGKFNICILILITLKWQIAITKRNPWQERYANSYIQTKVLLEYVLMRWHCTHLWYLCTEQAH